MLALVVIPRLGTIVQAVVTIIGLFGGPLLGVFMLGALSRKANGNGALIGAALGAIAGFLATFSGQLFSFGISFMWIAFIAMVVTCITGWCASFLFQTSPVRATFDLENVDAASPAVAGADLERSAT